MPWSCRRAAAAGLPGTVPSGGSAQSSLVCSVRQVSAFCCRLGDRWCDEGVTPILGEPGPQGRERCKPGRRCRGWASCDWRSGPRSAPLGASACEGTVPTKCRPLHTVLACRQVVSTRGCWTLPSTRRVECPVWVPRCMTECWSPSWPPTSCQEAAPAWGGDDGGNTLPWHPTPRWCQFGNCPRAREGLGTSEG